MSAHRSMSSEDTGSVSLWSILLVPFPQLGYGRKQISILQRTQTQLGFWQNVKFSVKATLVLGKQKSCEWRRLDSGTCSNAPQLHGKKRMLPGPSATLTLSPAPHHLSSKSGDTFSMALSKLRMWWWQVRARKTFATSSSKPLLHAEYGTRVGNNSSPHVHEKPQNSRPGLLSPSLSVILSLFDVILGVYFASFDSLIFLYYSI